MQTQNEIRWRAITFDDAPKILEMMQAVSAADNTGTYTLDGIRQLLNQMGPQLPHNSHLAETTDGRVLATGLVFIPPLADADLAMSTIAVHPAHRGGQLGDTLLSWQETAVRDKTPITIRMSCADHLTDQMALFERHGFRAARYQYKMQRALDEKIPERPLNSAYTLVPWNESYEPAVIDAFNDAFAEHWGLPKMTLALWKDSFTGVPQFRGDLSYFILSANQVIAFAINWVQTQSSTGWIEAIGVRPNWRGQGLAAALMTRSLNAFINIGLPQAMLDVDTQNPSGALRLYEKMGFAAQERTAVFVKKLT